MSQYSTLTNLNELPRYDILAVDTETDGLERDCKLLGVSFCGEPNKAYWLPAERYHPQDLYEVLKDTYLIIIHNAKFDLDVLARHGCDLTDCRIFDTMIASHLLDENTSHSLKDLAETLLDEEVIHFSEITPQISLFGENTTLANYACADADYTFRLYQLFKPQLKAEDVDQLFYHVEMPLVKIILQMEQTGIAIDKERLKTLSDEYQIKLNQLETHIFGLAGASFNLNSPKQLRSILYDILKLSITKRTKRGVPSTDIESLDNISDEHEIVPFILKYRELNKLLSTYLDKLPSYVDKDGRIHCSLNQIGTATGRFSSSNPNLQNIPTNGAIRSAFVAHPGHLFIDADFSQIELRTIAHYTKDPKLVEAYKNNQDLHKQTAASVLNKSINEITKKERSLGKTLNFALCYGMGAGTFSRRTGYTLEEANYFRNEFFNTYPKLKQALYDYSKRADYEGYIQNMFGRRRRFSRNDNTFTAFNALIQGTAGDICKIAMVRIAKVLPMEVKMLLQVHDEILFETPVEMGESAKNAIVNTMEILPKGIDGKVFTIPIKVDAGIGKNWKTAKS